jgi:hypothetical protein
MIAALQAETRKLASTRLWWVLLVSGAGYLAITAGGLAGFLGYAARQAARGQPVPEDLPAMGGADAARAVYALAGSMAYVFPLLIGVLIVTQEFRHKTVTSTFLAEPARLVVLGAKLAVSLVLGLGYGVVVLAATVAPAAAAFAVFGQDTGLGSPEMWSFLGRATLAFGLWAPLGVALGTLLRNQVAAIVVVLAETHYTSEKNRVILP